VPARFARAHPEVYALQDGKVSTITPEGRRVFGEARKTHLDGVRRVFLSHFSRDELRTLGAFWAKV